MKSCYIVLHNATLVLLAAHIEKCYNGIVKKWTHRRTARGSFSMH